MAVIVFQSFSGIVPRLGKRLLAPNQAQAAAQCVLTAGEIHPFNQMKTIPTVLVAGPISIFRMVSAGVERFLSWARDVDVARAPIPGDTTQRIYYTGDGEPRQSNFALATAGAGPWPPYDYTGFFVLGVFIPKTAPS